jgi:T4 RnlA family RNA ligase
MLEVLEKYHNEGLVYKQVHPTLPLTIWNYSEKVQYESLWDEVTLQSRGLVTDNNGNIVARPFKKFFNIEEQKHTPTSDFEVFEKMDGSLGILFYYDNEWVFATRGSFTSDQSVRGFEMLKTYNYGKLHKNYTYLFEIIYQENRIVCQYDFEDLVLLGMVETKTGHEVNLYDDGQDTRLKNLISTIGFKVVQRFDKFKDYQYLKQSIPDNKEGYVVKFSNGDRMKIKGEEYLRLHKIMTNLSTTSVWEVLSNGDKMEDLIKDVPDEFYQKIKDYEKNLKYSFYQIREYCGKAHDYFRYGKYGDVYPEPTKKQFAEHLIKNFEPKLRSVMFAMWDKKPYEKIIWKLLKPEFRKL